MAGVTSTGWETRTLEDLLAEAKQVFWDNISPTLDLEAEAILGQYLAIVCSKLTELWEAGQANYAAKDPDQATGDAFSNISKITGTRRLPARATTTDTVSITLAAGTYAPGTITLNKLNDVSATFTNDVEIITAGGALADLSFTATETGPIVLPPNTLTEFTSPIGGASGATNVEAGIIGAEIESDYALRLRREQNLARRGSATVDAIRADISAVEDVVAVIVLENTSTITDGNGTSPHGVQAIVLGGDDQDIVEALWASKSAGIRSSGSEGPFNVADEQGNLHEERFTRPTQIVWGAYVDVTVDDDLAPLDSADVIQGLKDALEATFAQLPLGQDVRYQAVAAAIMNVSWVVDITNLYVDTPVFTIGPSAELNIPIAFSEYAVLDTNTPTSSWVATRVPGIP